MIARISSIVVLAHPLRFISANTSHSKRSITAQTCKSHDQHFVDADLNVTTMSSMTRTFSSHITQLTGDEIKKTPPRLKVPTFFLHAQLRPDRRDNSAPA